MKNILILGCGFIGKAIAIRLVKIGFNVKVLSRSNPEIKGVVYRKSLFLDIENHTDFFTDVEIVIHTLSTTVPFSSMENRVSDVEENILINVKILDMLVEKNIPKILYISSGGAIYGNPSEEYVNEKHPTNPLSSYGITKLATEKYMSLYQDHYGIQTISVRPSNIYGVGIETKKAQGIINHILKSVKTGDTVTIWGDGMGVKDYLHINDFIDAISVIINNFQQKEKVYNIASGESFSIKDIIDIVEAEFSVKINVTYADYKKFDIPTIKLDNTLFKKTFNWQPKMDLKNVLNFYFPIINDL